ncbi:MAG TPA: CBS domain-containing protein [Candidatus Corynebacterium faecipullorum]|nr:CBS domain-containing protein [Candidatus Corynebacterium faecipullorum]
MSVEIDEVTSFLAQHEPFSRLPEEELTALSAQLSMIYLRRGDIPIKMGEENAHLHIIRTGAIDVVGEEGVLLDRRESGLTFGYSTLQGEPVSVYEMVAVEDSLVFTLPQEAFSQLAERNPDIARFFSAQSRQIRAAARGLTDSAPTDVLRTPLRELIRTDVLTAPAATTIRDAALLMTEHGVSSLLVVEPGPESDKRLTGILTDRDLRTRVLAAQRDPSEPVGEIMTPQPLTVSADAPAMEALLHMAERGIHHLPVVKEGALQGIVTQSDVTRLLHNDPVYLAADLSRRTSVAELNGAFNEATRLAGRFVERGSTPAEASSLVTLAADAVARRLCTLAEEELGPPPVEYAFVAVGSQGRREMALASDQDSALVLADDFDAAVHGEYFARLSSFVCQGLADAGQVLCPGDMMAMTAQWRMTRSQWIEAFRRWIREPQPEALLNAQIFFDFRVLYGSETLGREVHTAAVEMGRGATRLHAHLASLAARREPPLTLFRGLVVERDGDYANTLDIKKGGTAGIVQMARLFALASGSTVVDTRQRLREAAGNAVSRQGAQELLDAFDYLRSLSFQHQARQLREGQQPDYHIDPKGLGRMEREHLRDAFRAIKSMQNALATKYPVRNI